MYNIINRIYKNGLYVKKKLLHLRYWNLKDPDVSTNLTFIPQFAGLFRVKREERRTDVRSVYLDSKTIYNS